MKSRKQTNKLPKKATKKDLTGINLPDKQFITATKGKSINLYSELQVIENKIKHHKRLIIKNKLDFLFGYQTKSDTTEQFEKIKGVLINEVAHYKRLLEKYDMVTVDKDISLYQKQLDDLVQEFKDIISKYNSTNDSMLIKDAIDVYKNNKTNIHDTVNNIRKTKYSDNYIYVNKDNKSDVGLHFLVQNRYNKAHLFIKKA